MSDIKKAHSSEYCKVVIELQEVFINFLKIIPSSTTKGSTFNIDFIGESKGDIFITTKV